jgi:hypothetical protein
MINIHKDDGKLPARALGAFQFPGQRLFKVAPIEATRKGVPNRQIIDLFPQPEIYQEQGKEIRRQGGETPLSRQGVSGISYSSGSAPFPAPVVTICPPLLPSRSVSHRPHGNKKVENAQGILPGGHGDTEGNPPLRIMVGVGTGRLVFILPDDVDATPPQRPAVLTGEGLPLPFLSPGYDGFIKILGGMTDEKRPCFPGEELRQKPGGNHPGLFPGQA